MVLMARRFSITNFVIASSALAFQVFVLYPWHEKLDEDFESLKKEHVTALQELRNEVKLGRESRMEITELLKAKKERDGFWWR
ncbi:uncharacterized protein PAC_10527 [Phialocephala subalpina]|uniref:Uncharacterized protein n=1 Tax=Phialocephala subalpina TaxID=576137 RepID=A0A1L7X6I1_9HELO|nr:uncharacterized protein PAC_10527 [Phialocephala subalpina]